VRLFEAELSSLLAARQHGSRALTAGIAELLLTTPFPSPHPREAFISLARRILTTAPPFALLHDLFHFVGTELYLKPDIGAADLERFRTAVETWRARWSAAQAAATAGALSGLEDGMTLATISNSSAVRDLLIAAGQSDFHLRVLVSASYPGGEGATFVQSLLDSPHRLTLLSDDALPARIGEVDVLVFGADAVFSDAVMNKVGSTALAEAAGRLNRPVWVIAETQKWAPAAWRITPDSEAKTGSPGAPRGALAPSVSPLHLFERIRSPLINRVFSEFGGEPVASVAARLDKKPVFTPILAL